MDNNERDVISDWLSHRIPGGTPWYMRLKHHFFAWQYWTQWEWTSWLLGCDITKSIRHSHLKIYTFDFSDREWLLKTVSPCWTSLCPNTAMDFMTRLQRAAQTSNDDEVNNQLKSRQANIIVLAVGSYTVLIIQKTRDRTFFVSCVKWRCSQTPTHGLSELWVSQEMQCPLTHQILGKKSSCANRY